MAEQEGKTIHSVAKAIRLLDILTESGQPASLTELYQKTGWPKSTIHGLLSTMRESGLIEQTPNGRYWLGIRLFEYGCAVSNSWDIGAIARPHMQMISIGKLYLCSDLFQILCRNRSFYSGNRTYIHKNRRLNHSVNGSQLSSFCSSLLFQQTIHNNSL